MTHYVYRYFNADGRLLYIGCSKDPWTRYRSHRQDSRLWIDEVVRGRVTVFPSRDAALAAEKAAIIAEKPLYNKTYRWENRQDWTAEDYADYAYCLLRTSHSPHMTWRSGTLLALRQMYAAMFGHPLPVTPPRRSAA